ncbi:sensor histidine kinase [Burkholderia sp. L27(2015)]|uniref:sensor histidine kinase n=1 Tax=Burkholderia sp. L27(2015) TaxID=1641858 RepID=UPI00131EC7FF|nr:sensor histidine kinase [Burkholderia sp. L27(2015)]
MKREIGDFWWISIRLLIGCVLAGGLGASIGPALAQQNQLAHGNQVIHVTSAEMMTNTMGPASSSVDEASLSGPWTRVSLPHSSPRRLVPRRAAPPGTDAGAPKITTWYRVRTDALQAHPDPDADTKSLYIVRWQGAGELAVYADSRLVYHRAFSPGLDMFPRQSLLIPLTQTTDARPPSVILIRMDGESASRGALSSLYVGDSTVLASQYSARESIEHELPYLSSAAFLAVGFFSFAVWILRRREPLYFLFFAIAVLNAVRRWHFYPGLERLSVSDQWLGWISLNALAWQILAFHLVFVQLHKRKHPWVTRGFVALAVASTSLTLPFFAGLHGELWVRPLAYLAMMAAVIVLAAVGLWDARATRSSNGLLLALWATISLLFGVYDWLIAAHRIDFERYYLTPYAGVGLFFVLVFVMLRRYTSAIGQVEALSGLEYRVVARETWLADSYRRLGEMEQRQAINLERQRLMRDMHDGLGSSLMSALWAVERGQFDEAEIAEILKGCIDDLKLTIDSMEPVEANLLLLLAKLRYRLASRFERSGITLCWEVEDVPALDWLDPAAALHILRILQEAFTNIIKHTRANEIHVVTGTDKNGVVVVVSDNGRGFSVERALGGEGRGLKNQRRRAEAIGATIDWDSNAGGSRLILWLPLRAAQTSVG